MENESVEASAKAKTYTVKSGDSFSLIATKTNVGMSKILKYNKMTIDTPLYPGMKLKLTSSASTTSKKPSTSKKPTTNKKPTSSTNKKPTSSKNKTYTVRSGDSLSKIAVLHKMSVKDLKKLNKLDADTIWVGQVLKVRGKILTNTGGSSITQVGNSTNSKYDVDKVLSSGRSLLGIKYVWGGYTTAGFDCSGFVYHIFNKGGFAHSRLTAMGYYGIAKKVTTPKKGDLVFFTNTYANGPYITHLGVYIGDGEFIHSGSSSGVSYSNIKNWGNKFVGYGRL